GAGRGARGGRRGRGRRPRQGPGRAGPRPGRPAELRRAPRDRVRGPRGLRRAPPRRGRGGGSGRHAGGDGAGRGVDRRGRLPGPLVLLALGRVARGGPGRGAAPGVPALTFSYAIDIFDHGEATVDFEPPADAVDLTDSFVPAFDR